MLFQYIPNVWSRAFVNSTRHIEMSLLWATWWVIYSLNRAPYISMGLCDKREKPGTEREDPRDPGQVVRLMAYDTNKPTGKNNRATGERGRYLSVWGTLRVCLTALNNLFKNTSHQVSSVRPPWDCVWFFMRAFRQHLFDSAKFFASACKGKQATLPPWKDCNTIPLSWSFHL